MKPTPKQISEGLKNPAHDGTLNSVQRMLIEPIYRTYDGLSLLTRGAALRQLRRYFQAITTCSQVQSDP
jgi:hypothetical protein